MDLIIPNFPPIAIKAVGYVRNYDKLQQKSYNMIDPFAEIASMKCHENGLLISSPDEILEARISCDWWSGTYGNKFHTQVK